MQNSHRGLLKKGAALYKLLAVLMAMAWAVAAPVAEAQTPYPGGVWEPGPAEYGATVVDGLTVTTDDGITLQASVAYPTDPATGERAEGDFPVIVEFTPYLRLAAPVGPNTYLTEHGYIYAVVRPRGTGGSEGEVQQFSSRDGRDGKAVVDWAAHRLDGSDGRVGLLGCSYPGGTALATAAAVGPDSPVKAAVAACIGLNMQHRQVWTTNGLPNAALTSYAPRATYLMGDQPSVSTYFQGFYEGVMAGGPEAYDGYWQDRLPLEWAQKIAENGIPVLLWSGWSDINEIGALHAYTALQNASADRPVYAPMAEDAPVTPRYQLIMGDWGHAQGLDAGVYLQWFETWLKGVDTGIQGTTTPMHLFEEGLTTQSPSDVCPQDGGVPMISEPCRLTAPQQETLPGGTYTVLYGPEHPSALHLPQLPWQAFPAVRTGTPPTAWDEGRRMFTDSEFTLPLDWGSDEDD